MTPPNETYKTATLSIIALLKLKGMTIHAVERRGPRRVFFHFLNKPECQRLEKEFFENRATVPAKAYFDAIEDAKDIIFTNREI